MKTNILVKRVLGTNSVKQDPTVGVMMHTFKNTARKPIGEHSTTAARAETKNNIQPSDEFRYSDRCYCGIYEN